MLKSKTKVKMIESDSLMYAEDNINEFIKDRFIWKIIPVDHESKFAFMIWYLDTENESIN